MKTKKEKEAGKEINATEAEQTLSSVRSYFTKDILTQMNEMSVKEMESTMRDLASTRYWIAILKYTSMRTPVLDASLRSANPYQDPHTLSWAQGAMAGICDIEGYVIALNEPKKAPEEEGEEHLTSIGNS